MSSVFQEWQGKNKLKRELYFKEDDHWNDLGQKVAAEAMFHFLEENMDKSIKSIEN